ncbi:MAG TPA: hypothetical protein VJM32_02290 [Candidatus Saccharimonadales bacterium]|nr:hypothetical protein [Candidatus Saccharimonadales bacterium]
MEENNRPVVPNTVPEQTPVAGPAPAPAPAPQPVMQPVTPVVGGKKNKTQLLAGIIIAALLVAGGIAYAVYAYVTNTPDYLLNQSITQLAKEEAFAAKFKLTSGTESNGVSFSGDIAARGDKATKNGEAVVGIGAGDSRVTITARVLGEETFLRFGSLSNFPNLMKSLSPSQGELYDTPEFKEALGRVNDKWFMLTKEELAGVAQSTAQTDSVNGFKPEDVQKLMDVYNKHPFFKADKTFDDETIDNVKTAHFNIKIDKATYKAFLTELKSANVQSFSVTDSDLNNADKDADDFAKNAAVEFWVARDSKKLKQVKFAGLEAGNQASVVLTFVTELPAFEKLEKPAGATPFSEFMTLLLGPSLGGLGESGLEAEDL